MSFGRRKNSKPPKPGQILIGMIPVGNTILFGAAALGVLLLLYVAVMNPAVLSNSNGTLSSFTKKILFSSGGLLVAGLLYSVLIVQPTFRRLGEERSKLDMHTKDLKIQANTDALTGLHNRRYFEQALEHYLREFNRSGALLGMLILDLDHFKSVNDNYGHDVGDLVLQEVALRLRSSTREHDIVARLGGEEFAILTPYTTREQLLGIAERFRTMIELLKINSGKVVLRPTVSIGVATNEKGENNPDDLYKAADLKLYEAKNSGRNRVAA